MLPLQGRDMGEGTVVMSPWIITTPMLEGTREQLKLANGLCVSSLPD